MDTGCKVQVQGQTKVIGLDPSPGSVSASVDSTLPIVTNSFDIDAEMAEINGEDDCNVKENDGENSELNGYDGYTDAAIEDLVQQIEAMISKGRFTPSRQTVSVWKTIVSMAYDNPSILRHPDLKSFYQLFLIMGIRLEGDSYEIRIPVDERPKIEIDTPSAGVSSTSSDLVKTNGEGAANQKVNNGVSSTGALGPAVHLLFGGLAGLDNLECDYDPESHVMMIRNYNILSGFKDHISQILAFLLTDPYQLHTPQCEFLVDFLRHFGVTSRHISQFVDLVSRRNGLKPNFSLTHRALTLWMNTPRERNKSEELIMAEETEGNKNLTENEEDEKFWKASIIQLNHMVGQGLTEENEMVTGSSPRWTSQARNFDNEPQTGSESDDSSSDDEGFTGKRKRKTKSKKSKKMKTHRPTPGGPVRPVSLRPKPRTFTGGSLPNRNSRSESRRKVHPLARL